MGPVNNMIDNTEILNSHIWHLLLCSQALRFLFLNKWGLYNILIYPLIYPFTIIHLNKKNFKKKGFKLRYTWTKFKNLGLYESVYFHFELISIQIKKNAFRVKIGNVEHSLFNLITVFIEVGANVLKVTSILTRLQRS